MVPMKMYWARRWPSAKHGGDCSEANEKNRKFRFLETFFLRGGKGSATVCLAAVMEGDEIIYQGKNAVMGLHFGQRGKGNA